MYYALLSLNSLGKLVREGSKEPAVISVTLLNEGDDSYQPDRYGNRITVERRIPKIGAAGYRLLNHKGQVSCMCWDA